MKKLQAWWAKQPAATRMVIAIGIPLVAVAAILARRRTTTPPPADDAAATPAAPVGLLGFSPSAAPVLDSIDVFNDGLDGVAAGAANELAGAVTDIGATISDLESELNQAPPDWWYRAQSRGQLWQICFWQVENKGSIPPAVLAAMRAKGMAASEAAGSTRKGAPACMAALS